MIIHKKDLKPFDFEGLLIQDYTAGLAESASCAWIEVPPGAHHRTAWSTRCDKYYLVLSGSLQFSLAGDEHALGEGDLCLVRAGQHFSYRNNTSTAVNLLLIHVPRFELQAERFEEED